MRKLSDYDHIDWSSELWQAVEHGENGRQIAKRLNVHPAIVYRIAYLRGIKLRKERILRKRLLEEQQQNQSIKKKSNYIRPPSKYSRIDWDIQFQHAISHDECYSEIARRIRIDSAVVRRYALKLGYSIPNGRAKALAKKAKNYIPVHWINDVSSLMGVLTDGDIAILLKIPTHVIYHERVKRGIAAAENSEEYRMMKFWVKWEHEFRSAERRGETKKYLARRIKTSVKNVDKIADAHDIKLLD